MENYTTMVDKLLNKPKEHLKQMEHKLAVSQAKLNALIANPVSEYQTVQTKFSIEFWNRKPCTRRGLIVYFKSSSRYFWIWEIQSLKE